MRVSLCMHVCFLSFSISIWVPWLWELWNVNRWRTPQRKRSPLDSCCSLPWLFLVVSHSPEYKSFLLSLYIKSLYFPIKVFQGFPRIICFSSQMHCLFLALVCYRGATEGLSLFDLGCPALLPPPPLALQGGLWRHLGPLGGIIKPMSGPLRSVREAKRSTGHSVYPRLYFRNTRLVLMPTSSWQLIPPEISSHTPTLSDTYVFATSGQRWQAKAAELTLPTQFTAW